MKKITKAVIPAAGLGTRMLPVSKSIPKEMFPIVDKPCMQYLVEEAVASGITDILIINGRGKGAIEDHFDRNIEYEEKLESLGKSGLLDSIKAINEKANIYYFRQFQAKGLGHAVLCAKSFIGNDPFAVIYGDDVCISQTPVLKQLIDVYDKYGLSVAGVKKISDEMIMKCSSLDVTPVEENVFKINDMIEKPKKDQLFSNYSILGRVILEPGIFDILENTLPGHGGEIQLTDAMKILAHTKGMMACEYEGKRYDIGSKLGVIMAAIDVGLKNPEIKDELAAYIKQIKTEL